jgi:hypothetical protein
LDDAGINREVLLAAEATKMVWGPPGVEFMSTFKTLGFATVAALSLGVGAAMAQEGPNATVSGSTYFGNQAPPIQGQAAQPGMVQSGSSDVEVRPSSPSSSHYFWTPGDESHGAGSEG